MSSKAKARPARLRSLQAAMFTQLSSLCERFQSILQEEWGPHIGHITQIFFPTNCFWILASLQCVNSRTWHNVNKMLLPSLRTSYAGSLKYCLLGTKAFTRLFYLSIQAERSICCKIRFAIRKRSITWQLKR